MLAEQLEDYRGKNPVVLGILRGGLIVAQEIAIALDAEFDLVVARKLGAPGNPELAIGAITESGNLFLDEAIASRVGASSSYVEGQKTLAVTEIARRISLFRQIKRKVPLRDRTVIVADDGVATGATMQVVLMGLPQERPRTLTVALPLAPEDTLKRLVEYADHLLCLRCPIAFEAVGQFYRQFEQVEDDALVRLLREDAEGGSGR